MTEFNDLFVDVDAFRPAGRWQVWARELVVWILALLLLVGGWYFKEWMVTQFRYLALTENAPAIPYPAQWLPESAPEYALQALDPNSASPFPAREEVRTLPQPKTDIMLAWPEQLQAEVKDYHELGRFQASLTNGSPALLLSYTYVADTDAEQPAPIIIVKAYDLAFIVNDGDEDRLIVLTLVADSNEWPDVQPTFQRILRQMGVTAP